MKDKITNKKMMMSVPTLLQQSVAEIRESIINLDLKDQVCLLWGCSAKTFNNRFEKGDLSAAQMCALGQMPELARLMAYHLRRMAKAFETESRDTYKWNLMYHFRLLNLKEGMRLLTLARIAIASVPGVQSNLIQIEDDREAVLTIKTDWEPVHIKAEDDHFNLRYSYPSQAVTSVGQPLVGAINKAFDEIGGFPKWRQQVLIVAPPIGVPCKGYLQNLSWAKSYYSNQPDQAELFGTD